MLFKRRTEETFVQKARVAMWPRRSWWRSIRYLLLRVLRLTASPHVIAMGMAAGCFASFTPFLGFHFVIAFSICFFFRGSYFAAATGTFFGNPLTFPFIWASTLQAGRFILSGGSLENADHLEVPKLSFDLIMNSFDTVWPVIKAMTVGAFPVGIPVCFIIYLVIRKMAQVYKASRLKMLTDRARQDWANRIDQKLSEEYEQELRMKAEAKALKARKTVEKGETLT